MQRSTKITKGKFNLKSTTGEFNEVDGYVSKSFGIHRFHLGWRITHLESGMGLTTEKLLRDAKEVVSVMESHEGLEWDIEMPSRDTLSVAGKLLGMKKLGLAQAITARIANDAMLPRDLSDHVIGGEFINPTISPRIMIIGEAPGREEDRLGLPFVGRSGKLLRQMLSDADLLYLCYLTNLVKQRPPSNRDPTADEMSFYLPYLFDEIGAINPDLCILTGKVPSHAVLGETATISSLRGKVFPMGGYQFMPIFHPAYLIRQNKSSIGSPRWLTRHDLENVRSAVND